MLSCWKTEVLNRGTTKFLQGYIWVVGRSEQKSHASRPGNGDIEKISVKFGLQYKNDRAGKAFYFACRIAEASAAWNFSAGTPALARWSQVIFGPAGP
jgi:hypothetical protein